MTAVTQDDFHELLYLARRDASLRLARCIGKDRFETRGMALQAIGRRLHHVGVHPYHCPFCSHWHVGSTVGHRSYGSNQDRKSAGHQRHV